VFSGNTEENEVEVSFEESR